MSVIDKVRDLNLPDDQYVVIGSGLLDAWGLRQSNDIDLVVSAAQFDMLARDEKYTQGWKGSDRFLTWEEYEIFDNWGDDGAFEVLMKDSIIVEGVRFVSPEYLIAWKRKRAWKKDIQDITLLKRRLENE